MAFQALAFLALLFAQDFICPMDPDIHSKNPGKCPRCGMKLEARVLQPEEYPTYFDFHSPHLAITVKDPKTGKPVKDFEVVHEKQLHLFVLSSDLEYFAHIHPQDGKIDLDLPHPGNYKLLADFYPKGGTPQFIDHYISTPGFDRPLSETQAHLQPDLSPKNGENLQVSLTMEPAEPIPGKKTLLFFNVSPAEGLEQYLGAWSHMLFASDDLIDTIHTHPSIADGGKQIQFDVYFPRAATYRIWVQFQRLGKVNTVSFTVPVKPLR
jgi:Heavy metal binding domain